MKLHPVQLGICAFSDAIFVQDVQDVQEARSSAAPQIGIGAMFLRREMESRQVWELLLLHHLLHCNSTGVRKGRRAAV